MAGIAAAVTVTSVIWFTVVVMALGTALWPLLAGVHWHRTPASLGLATWPRRLSFLDNNLSLFSKF
jgi:hypothetical protein